MAAVDSFGLFLKPLETRLRNIRDTLALVGIAYSTYVTAKLAWKLLRLLKDGTSRFIVSMSKPCYVTKYGKWVVIAGGINGLGLAFATQYASVGMNVLLLSREEPRLRRVQELLRQQYNVEVEILPCNFLDQLHSAEMYNAVEQKLIGKDVGILINNVNYMLSDPTYFVQHTRNQLGEAIAANIVSVTMLSHLVLPGMIARKRGEVINVGSCLCAHPSPLLAMFCASKCYVEYLTRTLNEEVSSSNVRVRCLKPLCVARDDLGPTSSQAHPNSPMAPRPRGWLVPSADLYVRTAIPFIETTSRCATTGYVPHEVLSWLFERMSARLWARCTFGVNRGFSEIRQRKKSAMPPQGQGLHS